MAGKCSNRFLREFYFSSGAGVSREFCFEPSLGISPVIVGRCDRYAEDLSRLMPGQPGKEPQLDQFCSTRILGLQLFECFAKRDEIQVKFLSPPPRQIIPLGNARPLLRVHSCAVQFRRESAASPRPPRQRSGPGCSNAGPSRHPRAAYRPHAPAPWPAASGQASPGRASPRPACAARHTPAARAVRRHAGSPDSI